MKQYHQKLISEKEEELQDLKDKINQEDRDMHYITSSLDIKSVDQVLSSFIKQMSSR